MGTMAKGATRTASKGNTTKETTRSKGNKGAGERRDLYREVTDRIVADMERGIAPWARPWDDRMGTDMEATFALPRNAATSRRYSGVNILILWQRAHDAGFGPGGWMTFSQARKLGAHVRKGEKAAQVVHSDQFIPKREREDARREGREPRWTWYLKAHHVFHVSQIEGLPEGLDADAATPAPSFENVEPRVRSIIEGSRARFVIGSKAAYYQPGTDSVHVPAPEAFFERVDHARTYLHELTHWTGHPSRLDRDLSGYRGGEDYAREELVAELGAAFTCAALGIRPTVRHADYLGSWLKVLRNDKRAIFQAASAASKASDYLLAFENMGESAGTAPAPMMGAVPIAA